jgi:hypothetical protein
MPIARVMNWPAGEEPAPEPTDVPTLQGGGDQNGSQNTAHMMGQAGTGANRVALPRRFQNNYCGVI